MKDQLYEDADNQCYKTLLQKETSFYEKNRDQLILKYPNRTLLIHDENVEGDFETFDMAVAEGVRRFGVEPFLVKKPGEPDLVLSAPALASAY